MANKFHKILDKNGVEIPDHWSGRRRTYDEAKKMVDGLNKNGEHRPYTMIEINGNMAQQTAVNFLINYMCANFHLTDESLQKFEQAKAMEKEQIKEGYIMSLLDSDNKIRRDAEDYYNETYNK